MIVQKLKKVGRDRYDVAERYYSVISSLNALQLTKREIQLVAFVAIHRDISSSSVKSEFCKKHKTSVQTIYNIISRLMKIKVLIKDKEGVRVHPAIVLNFDEEIKMDITLCHG